VLAAQTTSNYTYMANAQRHLSRRLRWMAMFNGFHTGLGEVEGSSAHAENYGTNLVYKMYNLGANYSHTSGTALLTGSGLVVPPGTILPTLPGNAYLLDTGSSYSISFTANPVPQAGNQQQLHEDDQRQPGADAQHEQLVEHYSGVYRIPVFEKWSSQRDILT